MELLDDKNHLFKPFYSYCDISDVSLAKMTAPKAKEKKRNRGGKTIHRLRKNKRVKTEMLKSFGW